MRADLLTLSLAIGLAVVPGMTGVPNVVSPVHAEEPPSMFDAAQRFTPEAAALPEDAREHVILRKLAAGDAEWAVDFAQRALLELEAEAAASAELMARAAARAERAGAAVRGNAGTASASNPASDSANDSATDAVEPSLSAVDNQRGRLLWLHARALEALNRDLEAERPLSELADSHHPLAPWAQLRLGALQLKHDAEAALETLAPLMGGFPEATRARQLYALALARTDRHAEAMPRLKALVAEAPAHVGAAAVAMPLAELLEKRGGEDDKLEALRLYRRVESRAPSTAVARLARRQAQALLETLPPGLQAMHRDPDVEDEFALGSALLSERAYDAADRHFEELAQRVGDDQDLSCKARLERGRALLRKRQRKEGAELMSQLADSCADPNVGAWARYYAGRALLRLDQPEAALAHYDALPVYAPNHRLADDGLYRGALAAADADDEAGMYDRLQRLVTEHPDGDMRPDGLFLLAWRAYKDGHHEAALGYFDQLLVEGTGETDEGIEGRAAYFRARTLAALKRKQEAVDAYIAVAEELPLSYYAQHALARLRELSPRDAKRLERGLSPADSAAPLTFAYRPEMDDPSFKGAIALLQVGELERANDAFAFVGALGPGADRELMWLVAALYNATGAYAEASGLSRSRLKAFMAMPPAGPALSMWRIAYPRAFFPLIEEAAKEAGIPAAFVRAVAREESAFNPEAVSTAHAYGLIQLMRPTAREHARVLGLPSDPASLKRPEINLRIGSDFIRFLWRRYKDNPAVVPAAYNAGHGAAERWMRATPNMPLDEWVENIPYGETRRYTRRVLQTYGIYTFLETGKLPPLKRRLPRR